MYTIRKTCQSFQDCPLRYALANASLIMKGRRRIAYPRGAFHRYCNPRRDFKGWRKMISLMLYELDPLQPHAFDLVYSGGSMITSGRTRSITTKGPWPWRSIYSVRSSLADL
jgi:hypothetical protein